MYVEDNLVVGADVKKFEQAVGGVHVEWMFAVLGVVFLAAAGASVAYARPPGEDAMLAR